MWMQLLSLLVRRLLIIVLGNAAISAFLGPDLVEYLLGDGVVAGIVGVVGTGLLLLWSAREKILQRVRLKFAAASPPTTVTEIKEEVAALPIAAQVATAFNSEAGVAPSGAQVEKVVKP